MSAKLAAQSFALPIPLLWSPGVIFAAAYWMHETIQAPIESFPSEVALSPIYCFSDTYVQVVKAAFVHLQAEVQEVQRITEEVASIAFTQELEGP